jgi:hypothetical protein
MLHLLPLVVFLGETHVFLQLSWIDLFGANRAYLTLKQLSCRKYYFQKLIQFSQWNNALDSPTSNTDGFLLRDTCVPSTQLNNLLEKNETFSTLKTLICRKYAFQKLTQSSLEKNVVDAAYYNKRGFLLRSICRKHSFQN